MAHVHCFSGRTLPRSHRSTVGFGAAIVADALSYLLACVCLCDTGSLWMLLLLPLGAHVFYWSLLMFFRSFYARIHDWRLPSIYTDGSFCRSKLVAAVLDAGFHLLALVLLACRVPVAAALWFTALGLITYLRVFVPSPWPQSVQDKHA